MPREAKLFKKAKGDPFIGYLLLRKKGGNIPPHFINITYKTRCKLQKDIIPIIKKGLRKNSLILKRWVEIYKKECFYYGIRVLFELEREGKTKL